MEKAAPLTIRILDPRTANQIAAGEVIERPAAAVKELVENALDAGATRIEVEFRAGGLELIRVEDNGSGMSREDAPLSLQRHATSKLTEAADLDRLHSFGFRGEALPSIASVSHFTLRTRTADQPAGTEIVVKGGVPGPVRDCGRAVGTSIIVEHLFAPVPARRKFLKSEATESAHIVQVVRLYALAFPATSFALRQDGRLVLESPRGQNLLERVAAIFGSVAAADLLPLSAAEGGWSVQGLIGRPGQGQAGRHAMIAYVNRRPVDSKTIHFALLESYRESLPKGRYPIGFLFLSGDPAQIDVNVHPAKREIRFRQDNEVRGFLIRSILRRLRALDEPAAEGSAWEAWRSTAPSPGAAPVRFAIYPAAEPPAVAVREPVAPAGAVEQPAVVSGADSAQPAFAQWRYLGLAHGAYGLFEAPSGLVLLDRRAAAERVLYEQVLRQFALTTTGSQRLLLPIPLDLDPLSAAALDEAREFLNAHGFAIAEFGRNFYRLEGIPSWIHAAAAEPFLRRLIAALREGHLTITDPEQARAQLAGFAAGPAAALPIAQSEAELRRLLHDLMATRLPLTAPSGRPTMIELGWNELDRRFHRD
jgi:DNA mismatch repair protein MutL